MLEKSAIPPVWFSVASSQHHCHIIVASWVHFRLEEGCFETFSVRVFWPSQPLLQKKRTIWNHTLWRRESGLLKERTSEDFSHHISKSLFSIASLCFTFSFPRHFKLTIFDLFKMKQFHWLLCIAKNCDWSRKTAPLSNLTRASLLVEWKLIQRKQTWTAKSTNLEENAGKIKSVFVIGAALWAEKLGRCLENYRSLKNTFGKLVATVNLEATWFEFWMKGA